MRRRLPVLIASVAALALFAAACIPNPDPTGAAPLRYRDAIFTNVTKTADVTFGNSVDQQGQTIALLADVYEPVGDTITARPLAIWVHGGSFSGGDKTSLELVDQANEFARKGYVTASINYRLDEDGCSGNVGASCVKAIVDATQDAQTAVRYFRANAAAYGIDPNRIAMGGSSAGAIIALNVAYSGENPAPGDHQGFSHAISSAQSLSGAAILGGPIGPGDAAAIFFHNEIDPAVPRTWADNTYNAAIAAGLPAIFYSWPGVGHVPYIQNRDQILEKTRNWYYTHLDLANAAQ